MLKSRLPDIAAELTPRVEAALKEGAEGIARAAKSRVPVESGALRDAIHVEKRGDDWAVVAGDNKAFYGHMVEHGTTKTPPRPFLVPAAESEGQEIAAQVKAALKRL